MFDDNKLKAVQKLFSEIGEFAIKSSNNDKSIVELI